MRNDSAPMALNSRVCLMVQLNNLYYLRLGRTAHRKQVPTHWSFSFTSLFCVVHAMVALPQRCHWATRRVCACKYLVQHHILLGSAHQTVAPKLWEQLGKYVIRWNSIASGIFANIAKAITNYFLTGVIRCHVARYSYERTIENR